MAKVPPIALKSALLIPTTLSLALSACASSDKKPAADEPTEAAEQADGNLAKQQSKGQNGAKGDDDAEAGDSDEKVDEKQPITDDGYDDDWNNLGSQEQKQSQQKQNTQNQQQTNEPALDDQQQVAQQAPTQNTGNPVPEPVLEETPSSSCSHSPRAVSNPLT